jgi:hypothetical protein
MEQSRPGCLITTDVVPKGLIVDLTEMDYVDSAGERLLSWFGSVGAVFVASNVYANGVCERLGLSLVHRTPARRHGSKEEYASITHSHAVEPGPGWHQKEEQ